MRAARARACVATLLLGVVAAALTQAGRSLGTPPVRSWASATQWYDEVGPGVALVASVRVVALALALWLTAASALELVAASVPAKPLTAIAHLVAPRSLQRLVHGLAGVSLSAGLVVVAPSAGIHRGGSEPGTATMHLIPASPDPTEPPVPREELVQDSAVLEIAPGDSVTVEPGDSLWSLAEDALIDRGALQPSDAVVFAYWQRVVDTNRAVLVDPTNPDLIYSGQVVTLPPS